MDEFWLSHSVHEGPTYGEADQMPNARGCMVSIILDDDARFQFSAIRVLIICRSSVPLASLNLRNCNDTRMHFNPPTKSHTRIRTVHSRHSSRQRYSQNLLNLAKPEPRVCTIILELTYERRCIEWITLQPRGFFVKDEASFQVAIDHSQIVDPSNPYLLLFLDTTKRFCGIPRGRTLPLGLPSHTIHVVPITRHRHCVPLDDQIIRRIAELAVNDRGVGWRTELLSHGLVCRSWAHVLDLFFELNFDGIFADDRPNVRRVARSLETRPERASLMRYLTPSEFISEYTIEDWCQLSTIVGHATMLSSLYLWSIPAEVTPLVVKALPKLLQVRTCLMERRRSSGYGTLSMTEIQTSIANWRHLEKLMVRDWVQPKEADNGSLPLSLSSNIQVLNLSCGFLTRSHLLLFATSPAPCLSRITLNDIEGLHNHDFFSFLALVAPTLDDVHVLNCPMSRSPDEELALDAAIPNLTALNSLEIDAPMVSILSLTRKSIQRTESVAQATITIESATAELTLDQVEEAMTVTGWKSVTIVWHDVELDSGHLDRAVKTAAEKGVLLSCSAYCDYDDI